MNCSSSPTMALAKHTTGLSPGEAVASCQGASKAWAAASCCGDTGRSKRVSPAITTRSQPTSRKRWACVSDLHSTSS
ncbi:hypothetical protein D9M69_698080 [compost metagenome]